MRSRLFALLRLVIVVAALASIWVGGQAKPAAATDCPAGSTSDCFQSTKSTIAVVVGTSVIIIVIIVFATNGSKTETPDCREARAEAEKARKRARELRRAADNAARAHQKAVADREKAQRAVDHPPKESWAEDATTGNRWTTDAARLKNQAEAALTHAVATHEITREQYDAEMARLNSEESHQEFERQAAASRGDAARAAQSELDKAKVAEQQLANDMLDADFAASQAEQIADAADARAARVCGGTAGSTSAEPNDTTTQPTDPKAAPVGPPVREPEPPPLPWGPGVGSQPKRPTRDPSECDGMLDRCNELKRELQRAQQKYWEAQDRERAAKENLDHAHQVANDIQQRLDAALTKVVRLRVQYDATPEGPADREGHQSRVTLGRALEDAEREFSAVFDQRVLWQNELDLLQEIFNDHHQQTVEAAASLKTYADQAETTCQAASDCLRDAGLGGTSVPKASDAYDRPTGPNIPLGGDGE